MEYLINGNSVAGTSGAQKIRFNDKKGQITILSEESFPAYGRPLISYYLAGKVDSNLIQYRNDDFYRENKINVVLNCKALNIDSKNKKVKGSNGKEYSYDKLLIATEAFLLFPR